MWERFRSWPAWAQWVTGIFVALVVIGAAMPAEDDEQAVRTQSQEPAAPTTQPAPATTRTVPPSTAPKPTTHRGSRLACEHFRNVAGDVARGVLTDAELRKKLKEIDGDASIATAQVQRAATAMLAGITTGTTDSFLQAIRDMDTACTAAGY